jgi:hypothetical protein
MPLLRRSAIVLSLLVSSTALALPPRHDKLPPSGGGVLDPAPFDPNPPSKVPPHTQPTVLDPGPSPFDECVSATQCVQTDSDGDGIADLWEDKLAMRFAPELHLPPGSKDWTRPANVDWYLARVHMRFEHDDCGDCQILNVGAITQDNMWQQSHRGKNWRCAHKGSWNYSENPTHYFLQPPNDDVHAGAPQSQWRAYDHVRRISGGFDIQYWYFFPYNDAAGSFNHEADWEHITVRVDNGGNFLSAWYAQHNTGKRYSASDLVFVHDTHPQVWIADGSHASYNRIGSFDVPDVPRFNDRTYDDGPVWQTWTSLIHVGEKDHPRGGQHFVRYGGRWGEHGTTSWTTGPRGPSFQGAWDSF